MGKKWPNTPNWWNNENSNINNKHTEQEILDNLTAIQSFENDIEKRFRTMTTYSYLMMANICLNFLIKILYWAYEWSGLYWLTDEKIKELIEKKAKSFIEKRECMTSEEIINYLNNLVDPIDMKLLEGLRR